MGGWALHPLYHQLRPVRPVIDFANIYAPCSMFAGNTCAMQKILGLKRVTVFKLVMVMNAEQLELEGTVNCRSCHSI